MPTRNSRRTDTEVAPQFTPGPLVELGRVKECTIGGFIAIGRQEEAATAYVGNRADADLYRAAPDLLHALKVLLREAGNFSVSGVSFTEDCMGHEGPELARAAISKAEGR